MVDLIQQTFQGTVWDADTGEALPGVNIILKDSPSTGTVTDGTGNFSLRVPSLNETLVFSYVGYRSQAVSLDGNDASQVEIILDVLRLDEVVVISYGTQTKIEITSAVARETEQDFKQGGSRPLLESIQGRVPGLSLPRTGGGSPNGGTRRQLSWVPSIHGDQGP